jgi:hypothetical protein
MAHALTADVTGNVQKSGGDPPPIVLIPWDPDSPEHAERMTQQRIACGWKEDNVKIWKDLQEEGKVGLHWIVSICTRPRSTRQKRVLSSSVMTNTPATLLVLNCEQLVLLHGLLMPRRS